MKLLSLYLGSLLLGSGALAQELRSPSFEYYEAYRLFDQSQAPSVTDFEKEIVKHRFVMTAISAKGDWIDFGGAQLWAECALDYRLSKQRNDVRWNKAGQGREATLYRVCVDGERPAEPNFFELGGKKASLEWKSLRDVEGAEKVSAVGALHNFLVQRTHSYPHEVTARGLELRVLENSELQNLDRCRLTEKKNLICERTRFERDGQPRVAALYLLKRQ